MILKQEREFNKKEPRTFSLYRATFLNRLQEEVGTLYQVSATQWRITFERGNLGIPDTKYGACTQIYTFSF